MSCLEPAQKKKKENIMNYCEEACASRESSQTSVNSEDSCLSIDPFEDCSPIVGEASVGGSGENKSMSMDVETQPNPDTSKITIPSSSGVSSCSSRGTVSSSKAESVKDVPETWKGSPIEDLQKGVNGYGYAQLEDIQPSSTHAVLFQNVNGKLEPARPFPDVWDSNHVRMPFSSMSQYPVGDELKSRWEMVRSALQKRISNSAELEEAIMSYNSKYSSRWDFSGLHKFFDEEIQPEEADCFFRVLLPQMAKLALELPNLITRPIPLLRQNHNCSISMTQMQAACLLANAFFCTFPRRNASKQSSEYATFPDINFNRLFQVHKGKKSVSRTFEKLKCIFHYFRRVCHNPPKGAITFSRRYICRDFIPAWSDSGRFLRKLHISSVGNIEDNGKGMLQIDFANKRIGGGVLGWGCVQEEIRFVICPELIVTRLFTEAFNANEALIISGCEQFSNYDGYADDFRWAGDFVDKTPRDSSGRMLCTVVAIDALPLRNPPQQFLPSNMLREINKAFIGFSNPHLPLAHLSAVATGNWGCGAYRGNAHLKALLQILAAAQTDRSIAYFTFGHTELMNDVARIHEFLTKHKTTVGAVWRVLLQYYEQCNCNGCFTVDLYEFIYQSLDTSYVPKMNVVKGNIQGRNKAAFSQSDLSRASTSGATSGAYGGSSRPFGSKRPDPSKESGPPQAVCNKGQRIAQPAKEVQQKKSPVKTTHRNGNDDTNLRKANPASTQKRISDYFY